MPSIQERIQESTFKMIPKLLNSTNIQLQTIFNNIAKHRRSYKPLSILRRCYFFYKKLQVDLLPIKIKYYGEPTWIMNESLVNINLWLRNKNKKMNNSAIWRQLFSYEAQVYKTNNFRFIYTDGSKSTKGTSFGVVHEDGSTILQGIVENYCSVFTAESFSILKAAEYTLNNPGKFIICSDSLSALQAVNNTYNIRDYLVNNIRDILIGKNGDVILFWVPGHSGIVGNELADRVAQEAFNFPCYTFQAYTRKDILKMIRSYLNVKKQHNLGAFTHRYMNFNQKGVKANYLPNTSRKHSSIFTRLRIGHTIITHEHILNKTSQNRCPFCGNIISVIHILDECSNLSSQRKAIFGNVNPTNLLKEFTQPNIESINRFIEKIGLCSLI